MANKFDLNSLPMEKHSHVPFVIILLKARKLWEAEHGGNMPKSFAEKQEFKDKYVKSLALDFPKEVNFSEAIKNAYLLFQSVDLDLNLQEIFDAPEI